MKYGKRFVLGINKVYKNMDGIGLFALCCYAGNMIFPSANKESSLCSLKIRLGILKEPGRLRYLIFAADGAG